MAGHQAGPGYARYESFPKNAAAQMYALIKAMESAYSGMIWISRYSPQPVKMM